MGFFKISSLAVAAALSATAPAWAAWPDDKPIEVVVGFAPGGGTDLLARKLLPFVQKRLGPKAQFVVVNKPGAAGEIANAYVAKSKPDGYTLAVVNVPGFLYVPMTKKSQYAVDDFRLVSRLVDDPTVMVTRADSRFDSLATVLARLKQEPGSVTFGHNGLGTNGDLALDLLASATGAQFTKVPYKGTSAQRTDLLGGHLDVGLVSAGELPELHKGGTGPLRAIAQFAPTRSAALPQVPTAAEAGAKAVMSSERGIAAPRAVPDAIVRKLDQAIADSLKDPAFLAAASADAPVIAYLSGTQWQKSLEQNRKALQQLADRPGKQ